ncbi:MAG: hypothetical protein LBP82_01320 [Candidatus Methanoplasma sp.]|jgi:hypothetical protein|nr:hypothetical protein [Candidatus Methanoplasma sp.]
MKIPINRQNILHMMGSLGGKEQVFGKEGLVLGEFDPSVEGLYRNVKAFPFNVKRKKVIIIAITSDLPVDVAVVDEEGSPVTYKQAVKEGSIGPIPTGGNREMGIILGIYQGDKATVNVEIWMARA